MQKHQQHAFLQELLLIYSLSIFFKEGENEELQKDASFSCVGFAAHFSYKKQADDETWIIESDEKMLIVFPGMSPEYWSSQEVGVK